MYPNAVNMIVVPNNKKNGDHYENPSLTHLMDNLWFKGKWWKKKLFLPKQHVNIMYPNKENLIMCLITKRMKIISKIKVCLIWWMNNDSKENGGKKSFSCQIKASISCILIRRLWFLCLIMKRSEIIIKNQVCLIS